MIYAMRSTTPNGSWDIVTNSPWTSVGMTVVMIYFLYRVFLMVRALDDLYWGVGFKKIIFPKKYGWNPDTTRLRRTQAHCVAAGIIYAIFIFVCVKFGWIDLVPID